MTAVLSSARAELCTLNSLSELFSLWSRFGPKMVARLRDVILFPVICVKERESKKNQPRTTVTSQGWDLGLILDEWIGPEQLTHFQRRHDSEIYQQNKMHTRSRATTSADPSRPHGPIPIAALGNFLPVRWKPNGEKASKQPGTPVSTLGAIFILLRRKRPQMVSQSRPLWFGFYLLVAFFFHGDSFLELVKSQINFVFIIFYCCKP